MLFNSGLLSILLFCCQFSLNRLHPLAFSASHSIEKRRYNDQRLNQAKRPATAAVATSATSGSNDSSSVEQAQVHECFHRHINKPKVLPRANVSYLYPPHERKRRPGATAPLRLFFDLRNVHDDAACQRVGQMRIDHRGDPIVWCVETIFLCLFAAFSSEARLQQKTKRAQFAEIVAFARRVVAESTRVFLQNIFGCARVARIATEWRRRRRLFRRFVWHWVSSFCF